MALDISFIGEPEFFSLVVLPLLIFFARIADVTFGTLRIIFISRGMKLLAPFVAFFEIIIWLVAIGQVFQDIGSVVNIIAYAGGFAVGNYVGILVEERMAIGLNLIRIITQYDAEELILALKSDGFGVTAVDANGKHGPVKLIFLVVKRKDISTVIKMVHQYNPNAFYTIADVRSAKGGDIPHLYRKPRKRLTGRFRKGK
ncbi:DUF2179 domain-containing protein [Methanogenium organophilum]|uniref:UPF0316 protein OU421_05225 n=1 Tax=Methanogenium organophilum TaxID=2199 RepID=A0A9X9T939_METOG|nr:DUF2179 domain-containing protein [Methanogenium organophilum]WAI02275.1 DUF2179 domain-containing protein [Methanogenium organophilum]